MVNQRVVAISLALAVIVALLIWWGSKKGSFASSPYDWVPVSNPWKAPSQSRARVKRFQAAMKVGRCIGRVRGFSSSPSSISELIALSNSASTDLSNTVSNLVGDINTLNNYVDLNAGIWTVEGLGSLNMKSNRGKTLRWSMISIVSSLSSKKGEADAVSTETEALYLLMESMSSGAWNALQSLDDGEITKTTIYKMLMDRVVNNSDIPTDKKWRVLTAYYNMVGALDKVLFDGEDPPELPRSDLTKVAWAIAWQVNGTVSRAREGSALADVMRTGSQLATSAIDAKQAVPVRKVMKADGTLEDVYLFPNWGESFGIIRNYNILLAKKQALEQGLASVMGVSTVEGDDSALDWQDPSSMKAILYKKVLFDLKVLTMRLKAFRESFRRLEYVDPPETSFTDPDASTDDIAAALALDTDSYVGKLVKPWRDAISKLSDVFKTAVPGVTVPQYDKSIFVPVKGQLAPSDYMGFVDSLRSILSSYYKAASNLGILKGEDRKPVPLSQWTDTTDPDNSVVSVSGGINALWEQVLGNASFISRMNDSLNGIEADGSRSNVDVVVTDETATPSLTPSFEAMPPERIQALNNIEALKESVTSAELANGSLVSLVDAGRRALNDGDTHPHVSLVFDFLQDTESRLSSLVGRKQKLDKEIDGLSMRMGAIPSEQEAMLSRLNGSPPELSHSQAVADLQKQRAEYTSLARLG